MQYHLCLVSIEAKSNIDQKRLDLQKHTNTNCISVVLKVGESHGAKKKLSKTYTTAKSKPGGIEDRFSIDCWSIWRSPWEEFEGQVDAETN